MSTSSNSSSSSSPSSSEVVTGLVILQDRVQGQRELERGPERSQIKTITTPVLTDR